MEGIQAEQGRGEREQRVYPETGYTGSIENPARESETLRSILENIEK